MGVAVTALKEHVADAHERRPAIRAVAAPVIRVTSDLNSIRGQWRKLEEGGIQSPSQSYDFVAAWVETQDIPVNDQIYALALIKGKPLALLALQRTHRWGATVYQPFASTHVGTSAPLVDEARLAGMEPEDRSQMWRSMLDALPNVDVIFHPCVLHEEAADGDLFAGLGNSVAVEHLYRSVFSSWEECDTVQRTRTRRKHDRQQGQKLEALGTVSFEELNPGDEVSEALEILFADRAARFAEQGIDDPFRAASIKAFYARMFEKPGMLAAKLHLLKLDGRIVSARYHLAHKDRLFSLISSISMDPLVQPGSPGKQGILRIMEKIFDGGFVLCDIGAGFSDEKRHWCNVQLPLSHYYYPRTGFGALCAAIWRLSDRIKAGIKSNNTLFDVAKAIRARFKLR